MPWMSNYSYTNLLYVITYACRNFNRAEVRTWMSNYMFHETNSSKLQSQMNYRQVSNIRRTKSQHLKDSRTVLWLSLPNPLKPDVKSRMKM